MKRPPGKKLLALPLLAALLAGGCLSVLPEPDVPSALIALPADRAQSPGSPLMADVGVFPPDSTRAYSGTDIAVRNAHEVVYLRDVRLADSAPRLLQGAVIEALSGAGGEGRATPAQLGARVDYELRWRVVDFSVGPGRASVRAEVEVSLMDSRSRRVVAQQKFVSERAPDGTAARDRAAALALAAQDVADQVAAFVVASATIR